MHSILFMILAVDSKSQTRSFMLAHGSIFLPGVIKQTLNSGQHLTKAEIQIDKRLQQFMHQLLELKAMTF